jgi:hypothetical protein
MKGYHKTKKGTMAKKGLWYNIQQKKKRIAAGFRGEDEKNLERKAHQPLKRLKNHKVKNNGRFFKIQSSLD